ncbi:RNA polymerase sigma-70 factor, ECF subfamily [bacterium A37T11]|nr:RNA polymerase sigma-70 factor, ECF subfamily [bacterium A37T11]
MAPKKPLSDAELAILLKDGDEKAYLEVYDRYKEVLHRHAYKKLGNLEDANDVIQDLFAHLWINREQLTFNTNLPGYLYTATRNRILNLYQRNKRQAEYLDSLVWFINKGEYNTDRTIRENELARIIEQEIDSLPSRMREVFNLSRMERLSHKEISQKLGTSELTIAKQISKAMKILRERLETLLFLLIIFFLLQ